MRAPSALKLGLAAAHLALLAGALACGSAALPSPDGGAGPSDGSASDAGDNRVQLTFEVTVPDDTPLSDPVYITGDFQGWDPGRAEHRFTKVNPRTHTHTLTFEPGQAVEFKFTRGDWARGEKDALGAELPNRRLVAEASGTLTFEVGSWADLPPEPPSFAGDVTTHTVPGFLEGRRVWVYLPPGYSRSSTTTFPVLYFLDGQNVFDRRTSFAGEWRVDEAAEAGIAAGEVEPVIVVAVDNGGGARAVEYTPWVGDYRGTITGGGGDVHLDALVRVLKPWVDATYRTRPGPADTGLAGSSLGGLMGVYTAYTRSAVFGRVAALSPSVWWAEERLVTLVLDAPKPAVRLWTDMGTGEGDLAPFRRLTAALLADGFVEGDDLRTLEVPGAPHNESAWAERVPAVLRFLYPAR